jgi:hypothetical protein
VKANIHHILFGLASFVAGAALAAPAKPAPAAQVEWHESTIDRFSSVGPDIGQPQAVFAHIFAQLKDEIVIYPSEGYYYFQYHSDGDLIKGNIRLDKVGRDNGEISFAYFYASDVGDYDRSAETPSGVDMGAKDGLIITKIDDFNYRLEYAGKTVRAKIYEAKAELASPPKLLENEINVGPVFDESGVRFNLIFHRKKKIFYFVLNPIFDFPETYQTLKESGAGERIMIGLRSKFAFFADGKTDRMYLIGVNLRNVANNTIYDGPFDQLPDSFVDPDFLRDMIVESDPQMKGKLGQYGHYLKDPGARYAIAPYVQYLRTAELQRFSHCARDDGKADALPACLADVIRSQ